MITQEKVQEVFSNLSDYDMDILYELAYAAENSSFKLGSVPADWTIVVVDTNKAEIDYDSYGIGYTPEDSFVVVSIEDDEDSKYFKIPVKYASYNGWDVDVHGVKQVTQATKAVMYWESI